MKVKIVITSLLLLVVSAAYAVQYPSEPYVSPYSVSGETGIWEDEMQSQGSTMRSAPRGGDNSYCPYCIQVDPTMGWAYNECLQFEKENCRALYGEQCSIHGETSLPLTGGFASRMLLAVLYILFLQNKQKKEKFVIEKN